MRTTNLRNSQKYKRKQIKFGMVTIPSTSVQSHLVRKGTWVESMDLVWMSEDFLVISIEDEWVSMDHPCKFVDHPCESIDHLADANPCNINGCTWMAYAECRNIHTP